MSDVGRALVVGLKAPLSHWRMALLLWLSRLVPIVLFFSLPLYARAQGQLEHHPDARTLLDAPADTSGFAFAWTSDFFRGAGAGGAPDRVFWLVCATWLLVTVVSGGIIARLVHRSRGLFLAECGRYAGRFLRLALLALLIYYAIDVAINAVLAEVHREAGKLQQAQSFGVGKSWVRGALYLSLLYLFGAVHSYARIEIVARERRSAALSYVRALGTLLARLPKLLLLELGMLLLVGAATAVAAILLRAGRVGPSATAVGLVTFLLLAALGSYLRTGIELGTVAARCRLLAPPARNAPAAPSPEPPLPQNETAPPPPPAEPDEYDLSPENSLS